MKTAKALLALLSLLSLGALSGLANLASGTMAAPALPMPRYLVDHNMSIPADTVAQLLIVPEGWKVVGTFSNGHLDLKAVPPAPDTGLNAAVPSYVPGETAECNENIPAPPYGDGYYAVSPNLAYPAMDNLASAGQCNGLDANRVGWYPTTLEFQTLDLSGVANGGFWVGDWNGYVQLDCYDANSAGGGSGTPGVPGVVGAGWTTYEQNLNGNYQACTEYSGGVAPSAMLDWQASVWNGNENGNTVLQVN